MVVGSSEDVDLSRIEPNKHVVFYNKRGNTVREFEIVGRILFFLSVKHFSRCREK